ncbi:hypothetical protein Q0Z83_043010 [Actinoplanes sichuanensis]|uniref:Nephrocystin 3-like N-terminal domain-containing protein n=1 Tax=Actinoplanes sichuanensis TaxID=512349 RepID=A0ABW4AK81_9ACTN|nr:hypothetical protein [Actinoplanes sichuanensis]BEL06110.1 hypothetical protein Q0Z83_043010 [Actinoplanes sichuanensis]
MDLRRSGDTVRDTGDAQATNGGIAVTGKVGTLVVHPPPPPRSHYAEERVGHIAPGELLQREQELAVLAEFCTAADPSPSYLWWRAPAWAGKSALLSTFVLNPPAGVRVVSFFVTARWAAQNDRVAYAEVLLEQVAELLGESLPPLLTDATRETHLHGMVTRAAEACRARGERLVLVVDGLDEDRGVTTGADAYSIAALLPARPPSGLRVVVTGRPNPPIPSDVPDDHPLRSPTCVRELTTSSHATVRRIDGERELKRLLQGTAAERDLLGVLTSAGGGLSVTALAEICRREFWEIQDLLVAVTARTFGERRGHWDSETVLVLAHEELQRQALALLGPKRLGEYRAMLHRWADTYRDRGWPADTPEYLLRGYVRLLKDTADVRRLLALAGDGARHDRMLDMSGGDAAALAEIRTAFGMMLARPEVTEADLSELLRLRHHYSRIEMRNAYIPVVLPAVMAALGQPARAEALADGIAAPERRAKALTALVKPFAGTRRSARLTALAERAANAIPETTSRRQALEALAVTLAETGAADEALRVTRQLVDPAARAATLLNLAGLAREAGASERADALMDEAQRTIPAVEQSSPRVRLLTQMAEARAATGDRTTARALLDEAEHLATADGVDGFLRTSMIIDVCVAAATLDPARAPLLAERAEMLASALENPELRARALAALAVRCHRTGDADRARNLADAAETAAGAVADALSRGSVLAVLVGELFAVGPSERTKGLTAAARRVAVDLADPMARDLVLNKLAQVLVEIGDLAQAGEIVHEFMDGPSGRPMMVPGLTSALVQAGRVAEADRIARAAFHPTHRARAMAETAVALAGVRAFIQAEEVIDDITEKDVRADAMAQLAQALTEARMSGRAGQWADTAEQTARTVPDSYTDAVALTTLLTALAEAEHLDHVGALGRAAGQAALAVTPPEARAQVLADLVPVLAGVGEHAWARELADAAEETAGGIADEDNRLVALLNLVEAEIDAGEPDRAESLARRITDPESRVPALCQVAEAWAEQGESGRACVVLDAAESAARAMTDPGRRTEVLMAVVEALAATGHLDRADGLSDALAGQGRVHAETLAMLTDSWAENGDLARAERTATAITDPDQRAAAFITLARAHTRAGDETQTGTWVERARQAILAVEDPLRQARLFATLALALAQQGNPDAAGRVADDIAHIGERVETQSRVAAHLVASGQIDAALRLVGVVEGFVAEIFDPARRARICCGLAAVLIDAGKPRRAIALAGRAEEAARSIPSLRERARVMTGLAETLARAGHVQEAARLARAHGHPKDRARALAVVAAAAGPPEAARLLGEAVTVAPWDVSITTLAELYPETLIGFATVLAASRRRDSDGL